MTYAFVVVLALWLLTLFGKPATRPQMPTPTGPMFRVTFKKGPPLDVPAASEGEAIRHVLRLGVKLDTIKTMERL